MSREAFELSQTTWDIIQDNCPEREASEVKRVLGQSLVEEACDLYAEVLIIDVSVAMVIDL